MKKKYILILGVLAAITIISGIVFLKLYTPDTTDIVSSPSPFLVTSLQHDVFLTRETNKKPVDKDVTAYRGDSITTSITGRALLEFNSKVVTIVDRNSEFTIEENSNNGDKTALRLQSGSLWSRIEKSFEQGEYHEIETANAVATVRGTSFGVSYDGIQTVVMVHENVVTIFQVDEITRERILETAVDIPAGKKAIVTNDGIVVLDTTVSDRTSDWYQFNTKKEEQAITEEPQLNISTEESSQLLNPVADEIEEVVEPILLLTSVSLTNIDLSNADVLITLVGTGFLRTKSLILGNEVIQDFSIIDNNHIRFSTATLSEGTHDISVVDIDNNISTLEKWLLHSRAP